MSKPDLDLLHGDTVLEQETGTAVAETMEAYFPKPVFFQEPSYDGQIVWVKRCDRLSPGDVGIFTYDGSGYIKQYSEVEPEEAGGTPVGTHNT